MFIYGGIDEAGYGPLFGPLVIGRTVMAVPNLDSSSAPPHLWQRLSKAVSKNISNRKGRIVVNDSKKLTTKASGIKHLELSCLAFAGSAGVPPVIDNASNTGVDETASKPINNQGICNFTVADWLDFLGESCHRDLSGLPWYSAGVDNPWQNIPST